MLSVVRCTLVLRVYGERVKGYLGARRVGLSCVVLRTFVLALFTCCEIFFFLTCCECICGTH
jgi:hypothetical protein